MNDDEVTKSAEDLAKVEPSQHDVEEDQGAVIPVIVSENNSNSEEKVVPELKVEPQKVTKLYFISNRAQVNFSGP